MTDILPAAFDLTSHGIDIASFQHDGGEIDYQAVVADLVSRTTGGRPATDFSTPVYIPVLIKLTESDNYVNPFAAQDVAGFAAVQIPNVIVKIGLYIFLHSPVSPPAQIDFAKAHLPEGCNPVFWLDIESGGLSGQTWQQFAATADWALAMPEVVGAYTNGEGLSYVGQYITSHGTSQVRQLWFADPSNADPGQERAITQIGTGPVAGIVGDVDLDTASNAVLAVLPCALESAHAVVPTAVDATPTPETPAPAADKYLPTLPTLYEGMVGLHVNLLQRLLWNLDQIGAWSGWVDGIFGPATRSGVIDFQIRNHLTPSGVVDAATWEDLLDSSGGLPELTEGNGDQLHTKIVQSALLSAGLYLVVDGIYGPVTTSAVQRVQTAHGLTSDGIVGPLTWPVLLGVN